MFGKMFATAVAGLVLSAGVASAQQVTLKVAAFTPPKSVAVTGALQPWMDAVSKEVGDEVKFQGYWGGTLGRDASKQLKLMQDGIADVAFVVPGYVAGQFPDTAIFDLPMMFNDAIEGSVAHWRMYKAGMLRNYTGFHVVTLYSTGTTAVFTRPEIKDLSDLKGMKLRASGAWQVAAVKLIGATPVSLPANQMTESIVRRVLDGAMMSWGGLVTFKLDQATSYGLDSRVGVIPHMILMNESVFNKMSPKAKAAMVKHAGEPLAHSTGVEMDRWDRDGMEQLKKRGGTVIVPDAARVAQWEKMYEPLYKDWVKDNPDGEKQFAALKKILADIRAGR